VSQDCECAIDSLPIPVVQFHLVPGSTGDWRAYSATYGKVSSKKVTIFGYKLHLLITLGGVILDFELAPANEGDLAVGAELLAQHTDLTVYGDKGYSSAAVAAESLRTNRLRLLTLPRSNQKVQVPTPIHRTFNGVRQIIETVNGQLTEQFHNADLSIGVGFGLFAISSVLRYRTNTIPIREMTCLLVLIALPVINSIMLCEAYYEESAVADFATIGVLFVLEHGWRFQYETRKVIMYERIDMVRPENWPLLVQDLPESPQTLRHAPRAGRHHSRGGKAPPQSAICNAGATPLLRQSSRSRRR